ncbi:STAS-like domain-containing protein [Sinorhizobium fredii]|uniref:STAS-like domain-containing protein n=1 Tax=Rhizobium fredii TaxID=380 RepID=UPI001F15D5DF|nr:STAS-like domain-containing protein [Sinorhizobium fredii]
MLISIFDLAGGKSILTGSLPGRKVLADLIAAVQPEASGEIVFLDFAGVEVATSSFLRECVVGFRDFARSGQANLYPVVTNAGPSVIEELDYFARQRGDVFWSCTRDHDGALAEIKLVGELEPVLRTTFEHIKRLGEATAPQLAALGEDEGIKPTAWNNRLASLAAKGVVVEHRVGKTKNFMPLLEVG